MIIRNAEGQRPSLVVEDGESFTLSVRNAHELGVPLLNLRPRNTLALLAMTGRSLNEVPRLGDPEFFEEIERTEGLTDVAVPDRDGTLAGYGVPYLKAVLGALDPNDPAPPRSVKLAVFLSESERVCGCHGEKATKLSASGMDGYRSASRTETARTRATTSEPAAYVTREMYVPGLFRGFEIFSRVVSLADIVVGRSATLVLDTDVSFAVANNVVAYRGSRIVQRSPYLMLDVRSVMRGGLVSIVHSVTDTLKINRHALAAEPALKP